MKKTILAFLLLLTFLGVSQPTYIKFNQLEHAAGASSVVVSTGTNGVLTYTPTFPVSKWTNDAGYITPSSTNTLTNKTGNISMWTNDAGYLTTTTATAWQLTGNTLGNNTSFIGPIDNRSLLAKTNNTNRFKIDSVGIIRSYSTSATSTISGSFWFDGGISGNNGWNFYSDDPANGSFGLSISNSSTSLKFYQDHGNNNWIIAPTGKNISLSVDGGGSTSYQVDNKSHSWGISSTTAGAVTPFRWTAPTATYQSAGAENSSFIYTTGQTTYSTGTVPRHRSMQFTQQTIKSLVSQTITNIASGMCIAGPPVMSTSISVPTSAGLQIGGVTGTVAVGTVTNGVGLLCYAPTGATNNVAALFPNGNVGINLGGTASLPTVPIATLDVAGNARFSTGIIGTTTNDNAPALAVGEFTSILLAVGSATSFTTATAMNIFTLSLTAGDWDVEGNLNFNESVATVSARSGGITSTSATVPTDGSQAYCGVQSTVITEINTITFPRKRFSLSGTTTIYMVGSVTFSAGTCTGFGSMTARRIR